MQKRAAAHAVQDVSRFERYLGSFDLLRKEEALVIQGGSEAHGRLELRRRFRGSSRSGCAQPTCCRSLESRKRLGWFQFPSCLQTARQGGERRCPASSG